MVCQSYGSRTLVLTMNLTLKMKRHWKNHPADNEWHWKNHCHTADNEWYHDIERITLHISNVLKQNPESVLCRLSVVVCVKVYKVFYVACLLLFVLCCSVSSVVVVRVLFEGGGRRRRMRRRTGVWRPENKNPTTQCGEQTVCMFGFVGSRKDWRIRPS